MTKYKINKLKPKIVSYSHAKIVNAYAEVQVSQTKGNRIGKFSSSIIK